MVDSRRNILITGLYRSGTTFIEKALDTHSDADILHQPVTTYFKRLDELVWTQMKKQPWPEKPMGYEAFWDLYESKTLQDLHFDERMLTGVIEESRASAVNHPGKNSVLFPQVEFYDLLQKTLKPGNAEDILNGIFDCIAAYRGSGGQYAGLKEIFLSPYLPFMADTDGLTVINVIRDPREIYFSRNYNTQQALFGSLERHPAKMIATIWRNHILINKYLQERHDNIIEVLYDDIRGNADLVVANLLQKLDLQNETEKELQDESGKEWKINTSDKSGKPGFGKKWEKEMSEGHIAVIEHICGDLMDGLGYQRKMDAGDAESAALNFEEDTDTLKAWTRSEELYRLRA